MSGRFVRASKYRHVFGRSARKEQCYDNIRVSKNAWDTNLVKANPKYLSVNWDASGGGAFAVIPLGERGKAPEQIPLFRGHTAVVLDTDWSPFNDNIIASGSDDGKSFIWKVPEGFTLHTDGDEIQDVAPVAKLSGHSRKVGHVLFNPSAENVLATSSGDFTVKLWDIEASAARLTLKHTDIVQSLSFSANGGLLVTTSRDKKLRVWDARQQEPAHIGPGHAGAKSSRAVWMGEHDRVATTGFSKMSDRQLGLWDIRNANAPMNGFDMLDSISGVCMPFWDDGTQCLYLAGKGDGNIRYYEYENDAFEYLSEYKSADPQRGVAFMPKRGLNLQENEVARAYKTVNDGYIEPISFIVPRRAEVFQSDIYPPATGSKPGMNATDYFSGKDALPPKIDMESIYNNENPTEIPSDYKPPPPLTPTPAAEPKKEEQPKEAPQPSPAVRAPASMKDQGASMSSIASKFADSKTAEEEEEDDSSSFEEISKPAERAQAKPSIKVDKTEAAPTTSQNSLEPQSQTTPGMWKPTASPALTFSTSPTTHDASGATPSGSTNSNLANSLGEIKALLQQQKTTMAAQSEMIVQLSSEVDAVKRNVASSSADTSEKDERIRALEKEVAALRGFDADSFLKSKWSIARDGHGLWSVKAAPEEEEREAEVEGEKEEPVLDEGRSNMYAE